MEVYSHGMYLFPSGREIKGKRVKPTWRDKKRFKGIHEKYVFHVNRPDSDLVNKCGQRLNERPCMNGEGRRTFDKEEVKIYADNELLLEIDAGIHERYGKGGQPFHGEVKQSIRAGEITPIRALRYVLTDRGINYLVEIKFMEQGRKA